MLLLSVMTGKMDWITVRIRLVYIWQELTHCVFMDFCFSHEGCSVNSQCLNCFGLSTNYLYFCTKNIFVLVKRGDSIWEKQDIIFLLENKCNLKLICFHPLYSTANYKMIVAAHGNLYNLLTPDILIIHT